MTYKINGETYQHKTPAEQRAAIAELNRQEIAALEQRAQGKGKAAKNANRLLKQRRPWMTETPEQAAEADALELGQCMSLFCTEPPTGAGEPHCQQHAETYAYKQSLLNASAEAGRADPYYRKAAAFNNIDIVERQQHGIV